MTIIYLINHSTSKLFNQIWIKILTRGGRKESGFHNQRQEKTDREIQIAWVRYRITGGSGWTFDPPNFLSHRALKNSQKRSSFPQRSADAGRQTASVTQLRKVQRRKSLPHNHWDSGVKKVNSRSQPICIPVHSGVLLNSVDPETLVIIALLCHIIGA